ncbi:MAG TPA: Rid family detoxifying hydrolase [Gemmatimonadales bacterium]|nr:Rid family detoxifying hydrolase [Gemmatimonadales bacterium]
MRTIIVLALSVVVTSGITAQQKEVLKVPGAVAGLPFSPAIRVGNIIYLSGQLGNKMGTRELVSGGIGAETRQTLENIKTVVEAAGSSMDKVFKCTVFLADIADYEKMNEDYATFFPKDPPARSTIAGSGLALGARVEIECMAVST